MRISLRPFCSCWVLKVGQAIEMMDGGMPPHPMLADWAADYARMPDRPVLGNNVPKISG